MPRRKRPASTTRSEHWLRVAVNERSDYFNAAVSREFGWASTDRLCWVSPVKDDEFAEYYDQAFLDRLGLTSLRTPLADFWPAGGPRWDGLGKTDSGRVLLVEAKAYIEEMVDYRSRACPESLIQICDSLEEAKQAFNAREDAPWEEPFFQYTNRLAHLHFLVNLNDVDAYLLFVAFANAPDLGTEHPASVAEWNGAHRLAQKCLGLHQCP